MLGIGDDTVVLQAFHVGDGSCSNSLFSFSKSSEADDWIFRIGIDIHHGSKVDVHAKDAKLTCNFSTHLGYQGRVLDGSEGHRFGKVECGV